MREKMKHVEIEKNAKISIVIPVYNVEDYLGQCLESVLAQTFQDFEVILVDDGSIDKSGEVCEVYARKDSRFRVIHQRNQGQAVARNKGVEIATTGWILFIDSDDIVHPQLAEYLYRAVRESGAPVSTCLRVEGKEIPADFNEINEYMCDVKKIDEEKLIELYEQGSDVYWALFPSLIKKQIVEKIKFQPGKIYEDNALSCQWLYEAKAVAILPQYMYFYRVNLTSTMHRSFSAKKLDYLWALRTQVEFYATAQYKRLVDLICKEYIGATIWLCKCIDEELQDEQLKKETLKKTEKVYKKYRKYIFQYHRSVCGIEKMLHPYKHKIKKRLGYYKKA